MTSVADIQKDLPGWPDDVVEQWLHYFANEPDLGWPPPDPLGDHRWGRLLGGRPPSWWKNVSWKKEKVKCDLASFSRKARTGVAEIQRDDTTTKRFKDAYIHIMDHGEFPRALVTMKVKDGLSVLDGSHRLAAFDMLQRTPDKKFAELGKTKAAIEQEVWVGTHSAGEVPLT
jgi:hypothetical protein